jgi:predicted PurR-regulated permease PerM
MTLQRQALFWLIAAAVTALLLYVLRDVLLPFVAAMVLAYLLNPVAERAERFGIPRLWATLAILILFFVVFIGTLIVLVPLLGAQAISFLSVLPDYIVRLYRFAALQLAEARDNPIASYLLERLQGGEGDVGRIVQEGARWGLALLGGVWAGGQAVISILSLLVITPIVAFYILVDWPRMVAAVDAWLPRPSAHTIRALAIDIDVVIGAFLRGQAAVCLALAIFYGVALTATGLNFGLLIGIAAGLTSFIPYVGALFGFVLSVGVAIVQFWPTPAPILIVAGIFFIGQFIDGYVLQPALVGNRVGLHPVWLMFALFAFGSLFGFVGLLVAVPIAASIGVVLRYGLKRYQESPFYTGGSV